MNDKGPIVLVVLVAMMACLVMMALTSNITGDAAAAQQAQAAIEAARAAQVSAAGSAAANFGLTLAVIGLGVVNLALLGGMGWLVWRRRSIHPASATRTGSGKWVSGPNAQWGMVEEREPQRLRGADPMDKIERMVMLQMMRSMLPPSNSADQAQGGTGLRRIGEEDERWDDGFGG